MVGTRTEYLDHKCQLQCLHIRAKDIDIKQIYLDNKAHFSDNIHLFIPVAEINLDIVGDRRKMEICKDVVKYEFRVVKDLHLDYLDGMIQNYNGKFVEINNDTKGTYYLVTLFKIPEWNTLLADNEIINLGETYMKATKI